MVCFALCDLADVLELLSRVVVAMGSRLWNRSVQNRPWVQRQQSPSRTALAIRGADHCYRKSRRSGWKSTREQPKMEKKNCRLSSTISPGRYHCRNATLTGREVLSGLEIADAKVHIRSRPAAVDVVSNGRIDSGDSERPERYVATVGKQGKEHRGSRLKERPGYLWLKERPEIWKVATGAASFGVGKSHSMVDSERLVPVVLQAADRGGVFRRSRRAVALRSSGRERSMA
ncbi:hypothetical protein BHE74_00030461 [Ensete ventricosum]|nr:hypothetical protein BHE74_00030461 [Ensete ventricosum]